MGSDPSLTDCERSDMTAHSSWWVPATYVVICGLYRWLWCLHFMQWQLIYWVTEIYWGNWNQDCDIGQLVLLTKLCDWSSCRLEPSKGKRSDSAECKITRHFVLTPWPLSISYFFMRGQQPSPPALHTHSELKWHLKTEEMNSTILFNAMKTGPSK